MEAWEIAVLVLLVVGPLAYSGWRGRREKAAAVAVADTFGVDEGIHDVDGTAVSVTHRTHGPTDHKKTVTQFRVAVVGVPAGSLRRRPVPRVGDGGSKKLLEEGIRTGDSAFDDAVLVTSSDRDDWLAYLDSSRRAGVLEALGSFDSVALGDGEMLAVSAGVETDPSRLEARLRLLASVANRLAGPGNVR